MAIAGRFWRILLKYDDAFIAIAWYDDCLRQLNIQQLNIQHLTKSP